MPRSGVLFQRRRRRSLVRHVLWSPWTFLYVPLGLLLLPLAVWLLYEPIAIVGHDRVETAGLSGRGITLRPCRPFGSPRVVHCGVLDVPEDRASGLSRSIPIHVVVAFAEGPDPRPDPLFPLDGGPGVGKATIAGFSIGRRAALERDRDLVFVDIRGTGASNPLSCAGFRGDPFKATTFLRSPGAYLSLLSTQHFLNHPYDRERMAACRRRLEQRADLTRYTTTAAAAESSRLALLPGDRGPVVVE